jgi:hypothetical protein
VTNITARPKERQFHTLVPQFCAFCGHPILSCVDPKKHCKNCGRAFTLEIVAFAVGGRPVSCGSDEKEEDIDLL